MTPEQLGATPDLSAWLPQGAWLKLALSALALAGVSALRWALVRAVRGGDALLTDRQRWWISFVKNAATVATMIGLVAIWSAELEDFALSIAAVAVAVVIATKELLLCVSGAIWRGASQSFSVGDWIEIGPLSGEVIDENLLVTQLQEIDPHDFHPTGRIITAPNSLLLSQPVINHSFRKRFLPLDFAIHAEPHAGAEATRARIEAAVVAASGEFCDIARRYSTRIERSAGARLRNPEAEVTVETTDLAKLAFRVRVFCPRERAAEIRRAAMAAFLTADGPMRPPVGAP